MQQRRDRHKIVSPEAKYFPLESKDKDVTDPVWPARTATCCFVVTSQRRTLLSFEPVKNSEESKCKTKTNKKKVFNNVRADKSAKKSIATQMKTPTPIRQTQKHTQIQET